MSFYPNKIDNFIEKLNKLDGNTYVIEEVVTSINGVYESELMHDNISIKTLNIYTGSKLTGAKINTYTTSTPSQTPWKTIIKILSTIKAKRGLEANLGIVDNAETAIKLATARTINGVAFDGTTNITIKDDTKVIKGCTWNNLMGV